MAKAAKGVDKSELASQYGYALAFLQSDKSLSDLFNEAVKGNYTAEKFTARLKTTPWYRKNGESARQYAYLQKTDPATLASRQTATFTQIRDAAGQLGATVNQKTMNSLATHALQFGWNDAQIRDQLSRYVKAVNGVYHGAAANDVEALRQTAWRNGVHVSSPTVQGWAQQIAGGNATADQFKDQIRKQAATLAPSYAEELAGGQDLYDIAQPYIQSKAKILEQNPASIDLFDSDVRGALSAKDSQGKPSSKSLWSYEQDLRKSPAWMQTQNAQDTVLSAGRQVLKDFGFSW